MGKERSFKELQEYIHGQVPQVRKKLEPGLTLLIRTSDPHLMQDKRLLARCLWSNCSYKTMHLMREYKDNHLMRIAECGHGESIAGFQTKLMDLGMELSMRQPGRWSVAYLAAGAVLAALTDQVWDEMQKAKAEAQKPKPGEPRLKCRFCSKTFAKFSRGKQGNAVSGFDVLMKHILDEHEEKADSIIDFAFLTSADTPSEFQRASDKIEDMRIERKSELI